MPRDRVTIRYYPRAEALINVHKLSCMVYPEARTVNPLELWDTQTLRRLYDTGYVDNTTTQYYYRLTSVDVHGNESKSALVQPPGATGAPLPVAIQLALSAPRPNPARGFTTLSYALPHAGRVSLALYDPSGRRVRVIEDGDVDAGQHSVALELADNSGRTLATGVYLVRMEAEGRVLTQRVLAVH